MFDSAGAKGLADWMRNETRLLVTDTAMRDGHQSLLATRMRSHDIVAMAPAYAAQLPQLFSLECWGGATFDVAMRFLGEDPWERLAQIRAKVPNILLQMLLRGANGVGYTNYADNVVQHFTKTAAASGIDLFRIFDCLNWVENMRVSIDAVLESGKICEGAVCYTGDLLDPARDKYTLKYYVERAKELEAAGCHILGVKDMGGLCKPEAARVLIKTLREEVGLPIHFHTHDTSGVAAASVLAASEAGVDAVDLCMDALSGGTSQPCLGSVAAALRGGTRDTGLDAAAIREISFRWEVARRQYAAFEPAVSSPASEVYQHEMPGGQYTNLKEQARSLGLDTRWHEVAKAYAEANAMFGDIVKVTPSSKVVGDMALVMVSRGHSVADVLDPETPIAFPASVVDMLRGDLGQPTGGWPEALQKKVLGDDAPITVRPGSLIAPVDMDAARKTLAEKIGHAPDDQELASWQMYPKVFEDYAKNKDLYGPISILPTAGRLLRAGAGAGDHRRPRAGQDHAHRHGDDRRARRRGHGARLLRAQRPAALGARARPQGRRRHQVEAQGGGRQRVPRRRPDARPPRLAGGGSRRERQAGPAARRPGSHEDGDHAGRRKGRHGRRDRAEGRRPRRRQGPRHDHRGLTAPAAPRTKPRRHQGYSRSSDRTPAIAATDDANTSASLVAASATASRISRWMKPSLAMTGAPSTKG